MKEYIHEINKRNVMDIVFSRRLSLPKFPVILDVIFGFRANFAKEKEVAEFPKTSFHNNQNTTYL